MFNSAIVSALNAVTADRPARRCCRPGQRSLSPLPGRYAAAGPLRRTACDGPPFRRFSASSSAMARPLKCRNTHRDQLRSKLKLVDAKLSILSLPTGGGIGIQWVMFLMSCPEKKSIQCGGGLSSAQMPRIAFSSANSRTSSPALGIATHIGRQQNWIAPEGQSSTDICISPARTISDWV
jgi:hypothetical protein